MAVMIAELNPRTKFQAHNDSCGDMWRDIVGQSLE